MRETLTILAIVLILILTTALVGPYFVDWTAQRGLIEAELSRALGEKVRVSGPIDLKLLPSPYLTVDQVEVADKSAKTRLAAEGLRLEIAVTPLLRGEVDFIEAKLQSPRLALELDADGSFAGPVDAPAFSKEMRFQRITIQDGAVTINDPARNRSFILDKFDLDAEAASLSGPFKGEGSFEDRGKRIGLHFSTGKREGRELRLKLITTQTDTLLRADLDGTLSLETSQHGSITPAFTGNARFDGAFKGLSQEPSEPGLPWRVSGALSADPARAKIDDLELRVGDEDHSFTAMGAAEIALVGAPKASVSLKSRPLDLDRLLGGAEETGMPRLAAALQTLMTGQAAAFLPLPLAVNYSVDAMSLGGESLSNLALALAFGQDKGAGLHFEANGPGRSRLVLDGDLATGTASGFAGKIEASAGDSLRLADWLGATFPQWAPPRRTLAFRSFELTGKANISGSGAFVQNLDLRLDRTKLSGTLSFTRATGRMPPRLFADLVAPSLDFDALPDLATTKDMAAGMDLSLSLEAHGLKFSRIGQGTLEAGNLRLKFVKNDDEIRLDRFTVQNLGGANLNASGLMKGETAHADAKLDASRLDGFAALLARLVPGPAAEALASRAGALSPAQINFSADAKAPQGQLSIEGLTLEGKAGATHISAHINPDAKAGLEVAALVEAPEAGALLRQLAVPLPPSNRMGQGRIEVKASGPISGGPLQAKLNAALAGAKLNFDGQIGTDLIKPWAKGAFHLTSADLSPLLRASTLAFPDLAAKLPAELAGDISWTSEGLALGQLKGLIADAPFFGSLAYEMSSGAAKSLTGAIELEKMSLATLLSLSLGAPQPAKAGALWSSLQFISPVLDPPRTSLALKVKALDLWPGLSGKDARMTLQIAPGLLVLRDFGVKISEGEAAGTLSLHRDGPTAALEAHVDLNDYPFDLPSGRGKLKLGLDLAGTGQSAQALVVGLAGSGHTTVSDLLVPHGDPSALPRIFANVEEDRLPVETDTVARALNSELDRQSLAAGSRDFDLNLAAGTIRFDPVASPKPKADVTSDFSAGLDLVKGTLDQRLALTLHALPKDWTGPPPQVTLNFKGPIASQSRTIEADAFVNALAARAIMRESARIEAFEFDVRERAFFNRRLISERRREQERIKAEEDARRAEEERRQAAETARRERLKKAEEARHKAEEAQRASEAQRANASGETKPPGSWMPPVLSAPGVLIDPSAAGRY